MMTADTPTHGKRLFGFCKTCMQQQQHTSSPTRALDTWTMWKTLQATSEEDPTYDFVFTSEHQHWLQLRF